MNRASSLTLVFCLCLFAFSRTSDAAFLDAPAWIAEGDRPGAQFGFSVASAGDVNADGYADVLVGAPRFDRGNGDTGAAFLYLGSAAGLSPVPSWTAESDQAGARFGFSVAAAGDVNGDGFDDVLIGAPLFDTGETDEGVVLLYLGMPAGLSLSAAATWEGGQAGAEFGASVARAGDVDGDGLGDMLIGAPGFDASFGEEGAAYLFLGSSSLLPTSSAWSATGEQLGARFGSSVAGLGDITGDGIDDVGIGAPLYDGGQADEGQVRMFAGSPSGLGVSPVRSFEANKDSAHFGFSLAGAGDLNADGHREILFGAPLYDYTNRDEGGTWFAGMVQPVFFLTFGAQDFAQRGVSIASAGDVNGDGLNDVIVGSDRFDQGETDEGHAALHLGSESFVVDRAPAGTADGDQPFAAFGFAVAGAGDVDGDGFADMIVGAPLYDHGETDEGRVLVFLGGPGSAVAVSDDLTSPDRPTLRPARPDPFRASTTLTFALSRHGEVRLSVLDAAGRERVVLAEGDHVGGTHAVTWDGRDGTGREVPAGIYFVRLAFEGRDAVGKVVRLSR